MEPIYTKHVTTLPDQGGEGTSRLLRHLDPAAPAPDALDASDDRDARDVVRAAPDRSASPPSSLTLGLGWQRWIVARSSGLSACAA